MDTDSQVNLSSNIDGGLEGQYIKVGQGKNIIVGKVLLVTGSHTMTVRWYSRWEWFWISISLFFVRLYEKLRRCFALPV